MSIQSPLTAILSHEGANFREYPGGSLPQDFGDAPAEYRMTLSGVSIFDRSTTGKIELTGPDAPSFLHNLSTNDIENLPLGAGVLAYFCTPTAKVIAEGVIYHILLNNREHALWLETTPGYDEKLFKHLDKHLIAEQVEIGNRTADFAQIHLAGPNAKAIIEKVLGSSIPDLQEFQHMERTFGTESVCHLRRHDPLGVPGYDLVCLNERAKAIWQMLRAAGASPAGQDAWELLRVEAGTPIYGIDIDENRFVMELPNPLRAVSYNKGCYLGQEPIVMARDRAGYVNRTFKSVRGLTNDLLPAGTKLFNGEMEVGLITSSIHSPKWNAPLSIGYLKRGHQDSGLKLIAKLESGPVAVEVI